MRILTVHPGPEFSVADVHAGWANAFRQLGQQVATYNLHDRLNFYETAGTVDPATGFRKLLATEDAVRLAAKGIQAACYEMWPDVLFVVSGFYVPADILDLVRSRHTKVVILHTEEPYEVGRELVRAEHADLNLVNDPTYLHLFQELGPAFYSPHCYDPDIHHPAPPRGPDDTSDFCFVGTGYPSRTDFFAQVDFEGIDVALGGNWQNLPGDSPLRKHVCHDIGGCIDNRDAVWLYRGAQMSANLYRTEADRPELSAGWSMGPREVELAATGCPFLRQPRPESDAVLGMLPTFDGPEEFGDKLRWHLARPGVLADLACRAREAITDRTFKTSAAGLLRTLERLPTSIPTPQPQGAAR